MPADAKMPVFTKSRIERRRGRFQPGLRLNPFGPQRIWVPSKAYCGPPMSWTPDEVFVLTLARRPDRLDRFQRNLVNLEWPFKAPEVFLAVDGYAAAVPGNWPFTPGAWGCLRSHAMILQAAQTRGARSLLILEDDAIFPLSFAARVRQILNELPPTWEGLMMGGQHVRTPIGISERLSRCRGTVRTHCYAVRGPLLARLERAYSRGVGHADRILARLMTRFEFYAPVPFLVGQAAGASDIDYRLWPTRFTRGSNNRGHKRSPRRIGTSGVE